MLMRVRLFSCADGHMQPAPSIELPNQDAEYVSHIALDIGGSLIKLVYFSPDPHGDPMHRPSSSNSSSRGGEAAQHEAWGMRHRVVHGTVSCYPAVPCSCALCASTASVTPHAPCVLGREMMPCR